MKRTMAPCSPAGHAAGVCSVDLRDSWAARVQATRTEVAAPIRSGGIAAAAMTRRRRTSSLSGFPDVGNSECAAKEALDQAFTWAHVVRVGFEIAMRIGMVDGRTRGGQRGDHSEIRDSNLTALWA